MTPNLRRLFLMVLGIAIGVGLGSLMYVQQAAHTVVPVATSGPVGAPLLLNTVDGKQLTLSDFGQKHMLVFFGFTHCPAFCPAALGKISDALADLTSVQRAKLDVYFVTIDPDRDTPTVLKTYLSNFDSQITGLVGTQTQISDVLAQWKAYAAKVPLEGDDYTMDHSTFIYLVDPQFNLLQLFKDTDTPDSIAAGLTKVL